MQSIMHTLLKNSESSRFSTPRTHRIYTAQFKTEFASRSAAILK